MINYNDLTSLKKSSKLSNFDEQYDECKKNITNLFNEHNDCTPLFISIVGSTSFGLSTENSDLDIKFVYIQDLKVLLSELSLCDTKPFLYKKNIETDKNNLTGYEISRFLKLLLENKPNYLELINTPEDCIVYKHPIWDFLLNEINTIGYISKRCFATFSNYAKSQINKSKGLNKKINNPIAFERKSPLDFCYVIDDSNSDSISLRKYLEDNRLDQKLCGLTKVPHAKDLYSLYYDEISDLSFSKYRTESERNLHRVERKESGETMGLGYKGIIKEAINNEEEVSNEIRLSSIPKEEVKICNISYNKDGYTKYCKDYKEYWGEKGWKNNRNEDRYNDNIKSGQNYDGKNLSHCLRLLYMAKEISQNKGIIVRRDEKSREELLSVKKGLWEYDDIIALTEKLTFNLEEDYNKSELPDDISSELISELLFKIRKEYYRL